MATHQQPTAWVLSGHYLIPFVVYKVDYICYLSERMPQHTNIEIPLTR